MLNLDKQMTRIEQSNIDLTAQFKCQIAELEQLKSTVTSQPPLLTPAKFQQCHAAQLKELEGLTTAIKAQPKPSPPVLDYSKIKFPPLPSPPPATKQVNMPTPATIRKEIRISQDAERRKCNVILRGLRCDPETDPTVATKSFLKSCNIENYNLYQNDLVTAHFLNRRDDYCTIRVVFSNHWTAENILNSAHQLKKCQTIRQSFLVTACLNAEFLIGLDFLEKGKMCIDLLESCLRSDSGRSEFIKNPTSITRVAKLHLKDSVKISPNTISFVEGLLPGNGRDPTDRSGLLTGSVLSYPRIQG